MTAMNQRAAAAAGATRWEHFPHDADVGVKGFGATPAQAFEQAAQALTAVVTNAEVAPKLGVEVSCEGPDLEILFVEWLNAIIYEMAVRKMLFSRFAVEIEDSTAQGNAVGRAGRCRAACPGLRAQGRHLHGAQGRSGP